METLNPLLSQIVQKAKGASCNTDMGATKVEYLEQFQLQKELYT